MYARTSSKKRPAPHEQQNSVNNNNVESIAAKIQSRANELENERARLEQLESERQQQTRVLQEARNQLLGTRTSYLHAMRELYGVELEVRQLQQERLTLQEETQELDRQREQIEKETLEKQAAWEERIQVFAAHQLKRQLYQRHLQGKIRACQEGQAKRQQKLKILAEKADALVQEEAWTKEQTQQVLLETKQLEEEEEQDNGKVHELALEVRSRLTKRAALRESLRKAQQEYKAANDEAFERERELMGVY